MKHLFQNTFKGSQLDSSRGYTLIDSKSSFVWKTVSGNMCNKEIASFTWGDVFLWKQQYEKKT